ncbi:hypothetical protein SAY87_024819 [Trapa incisa]|uniref:Uncharacterized protein n=1 Tax=Trapa incisa TaxID=236973 RepID=A0AAN7J8Y5_9MYRT|nr:hypothetical protein SAY87_024819 [Trapa incisa]
MSRSGMVIHPIHRRWCDEVTTSLTAERVATSNQPLIGKWKGFNKMCGRVAKAVLLHGVAKAVQMEKICITFTELQYITDRMRPANHMREEEGMMLILPNWKETNRERTQDNVLLTIMSFKIENEDLQLESNMLEVQKSRR